MITLSEEMVRLQAKTNERSCLFYEDLTQDCLIYAHRPLECRVMKCWDTQEIKRVYSQDRVKRLDLIPADSALGEIIREHEQQCSIDVLKEALKEMKMARNERALQTISSIISQDETFRDYMKKRAKTQDDTLSFLFGRPIKDIMKTFGFTLLSTETGHPDKIIASGTI
jgi:Fe-S-cluster containining protein